MKTNILKLMNSRIFPILILIIFFLLSFGATSGFDFSKKTNMSVTNDEVSHIGAGYYYLTTGKMLINPEHPALTKIISALPLLFLDLKAPEFTFTGKEIDPDSPWGFVNFPISESDLNFNLNTEYDNKTQWFYGKAFLFNSENVEKVDLILRLARTSVLVVNTILIYILYTFLTKLFTKKIGIIFLSLICFSPTVIAHSALVTTDVMSSLLQILSVLTFGNFLNLFFRKKEWKKYFTFAIFFFVLAQITKFNSIILAFIFGLFLPYFLIKFITKKTQESDRYKKAIFLLITFFLISFSFIILTHLPLVANTTAEEMSQLILFNIDPGIKEKLFGLWEFGSAVAQNGIFSRALVQYLLGMSLVFGRISGGNAVYFMNEVYSSGGIGYIYFPILYLTKNTLAVLLLVLVLVAFLISKFKKIKIEKFNIKNLTYITYFFKNKWDLLLLVIFVSIYTFTAVTSSLQIGLRHIMPVLIGSYLLLAICVSRINFKKSKYIICSILISGVLSTLLAYPSFLPYYNILAGGTKNGYQIAVDSNYDWGQDMNKFGDWVKTRTEKKLYIDFFTGDIPERFTQIELSYFNKKALPKEKATVLISVFFIQADLYGDDEINTNIIKTLIEKGFVEKLGNTIWVFNYDPSWF